MVGEAVAPLAATPEPCSPKKPQEPDHKGPGSIPYPATLPTGRKPRRSVTLALPLKREQGWLEIRIHRRRRAPPASRNLLPRDPSACPLACERPPPAITASRPTPLGHRPARVSLTLKDGTQLKAEAFVNKGDFEDPYTADDLLEKYHELVTPVWGEDTAQKVHAAVADMDKMPDVNELTRFLTP